MEAHTGTTQSCAFDCSLRLVTSFPPGLPAASKFSVYKVILDEKDERIFGAIAPPYIFGPPGITNNLFDVKTRATIRTPDMAAAIVCKDKYVPCRGMNDLVMVGLCLNMRLSSTKRGALAAPRATFDAWLSSGALEAIGGTSPVLAPIEGRGASGEHGLTETETDPRYGALAFEILEMVGTKPGITPKTNSRYLALFEGIVRNGLVTPTSTPHALKASASNSPPWKIIALGDTTHLDGSVLGRDVEVTSIAAAFSGKGSLKSPPKLVSFARELAIESALRPMGDPEGDERVDPDYYDGLSESDYASPEEKEEEETLASEPRAYLIVGSLGQEERGGSPGEVELGSEDTDESDDSYWSDEGSDQVRPKEAPANDRPTENTAAAPEFLLAPNVVSRAQSRHSTAAMGLVSTSPTVFLWLVDCGNQARDFSPALLRLLRIYGWAAISALNLMTAEHLADLAALAPEAAFSARLLVASARFAVYVPRFVKNLLRCEATVVPSPLERAAALVDLGRGDLAMDARLAAGLRDSFDLPADPSGRLVYRSLASDPARVAAARTAARDLLRGGWVVPAEGRGPANDTTVVRAEPLHRILYAEDLVARALASRRAESDALFGFRESPSAFFLYDAAAASVLEGSVVAVVTSSLAERDAIRALIVDGVRYGEKTDVSLLVRQVLAVEEAASFLVNPSRENRRAAAEHLLGRSFWCRNGNYKRVVIFGAKLMDYAQLAAATYCADVLADAACYAISLEDEFYETPIPLLSAGIEFWDSSREDFRTPFATGAEGTREAAFFELRAAGWISELPPTEEEVITKARPGASSSETTGGIRAHGDGEILPYADSDIWSASAASLPEGPETTWRAMPRLNIDGRRPTDDLKGCLGEVTGQLSAMEAVTRLLEARAAGRDVEAEEQSRAAYRGDWPDLVLYGGKPPGDFRSEPEAAEAFLHWFGIMPNPEVQAAPGARALLKPDERVYVEDTGELGTVRRLWSPFTDDAPQPTWPMKKPSSNEPSEYVRHCEERTVIQIERARHIGCGRGVRGRAVGDLSEAAAEAADCADDEASEGAAFGGRFRYRGPEVIGRPSEESAHGRASSCCRSGAFCAVLEDVSERLDFLPTGNTLLRAGAHRIIGAQALRASVYRGAPVPRAVLILFPGFSPDDIVAAAVSCGRLAVIMVAEARVGLPPIGSPEAAAVCAEENESALAEAAFRLASAGPLRPMEGAVACAVATPERRARIAKRAAYLSGCDGPRAVM